jgi:hypothetical protein
MSGASVRHLSCGTSIALEKQYNARDVQMELPILYDVVRLVFFFF